MCGDLEHGFTVDGEPLGFYHFTGFDSGAHRIMAFKNASGNAAVQELISWYGRETSPGRGDPINRWPWAFGRFSDGTAVEPHHRWLYRHNRDLQLAFPDPYDTQAKPLTFLGWCNTEGRLRYPHIFKAGAVGAVLPDRARSGISLATALRLLMPMFAPKGGKLIRSRIVRVLRSEGVGGIARRLRSHQG
jgi:hypothetical protein